MNTRSMARRAVGSIATTVQPNATANSATKERPANVSTNDDEPSKKALKTKSTAARKQGPKQEPTKKKPAKNQMEEAPTELSAASELGAASPLNPQIESVEKVSAQSTKARNQPDEVGSIETQILEVGDVATKASELGGIEADATDTEEYDMADWWWDDIDVQSDEVHGDKQTENSRPQSWDSEIYGATDNYRQSDRPSKTSARKWESSEPVDDSRATKRPRSESLNDDIPSLPAAPHRFWHIAEMVNNLARIIADSCDSCSPEPSRMQRQTEQNAKANLLALGGTDGLLYRTVSRWKVRDLKLEKDGLNVVGPCNLHKRDDMHGHCFECHERELLSLKHIGALTATSFAPTIRSLSLSGDWSMECLGHTVERAHDQGDPLLTDYLGSTDETSSDEYARLGKAWLTKTLKSCKNLHILHLKGVLPEMITKTMEALQDSGLQITTLGLGTDNRIHKTGLYSFLDSANVSPGRSPVNYAAIFASLETIQLNFGEYKEHGNWTQEGPLSEKIEMLFRLTPRLDHLIVWNECVSHHLESLISAISTASGFSLINMKIRGTALENLLIQRKASLRSLHLEDVRLQIERQHCDSKSWSDLLELITHSFGTLESLTLGGLTYDWLASWAPLSYSCIWSEPRRFAHKPSSDDQDPRDVCDDAFGPLMSLSQDGRNRWLHFREWLDQYQRLSKESIVTNIEKGACHSEYNQARCIGRTEDGMRCHASTYAVKKYHTGGLVWFCDHHKQHREEVASWPYPQRSRW